jgi:uncharacterized protein (DUF1501 family)
MNRRDLLKWTGGLAAATALATAARTTKLAFGGPRAAGARSRLLLVFAQGGWDTSYALDPKAPPDVDVPSGAARLYGNLDVFVDDTARPNVSEFFNRYASHTAIIRGIATASVAHAECAKRIATGTRDETNPDMGAIVAHDNGNALPMPYLILGDTAYTGPYAVSAGRVGATNQIIALLDKDARYDTGGTGFATDDAENALLARYAGASADRARAVRGANGYNRKRVDDFVEAIDRAERLRGVRDGFGNRGRTLQFADQIDLALQALQTGISQTVMMNTRQGWDTHDTNDDQALNHEETFGSLTYLLEQLEALPGVETGKKMIDDTTVVVISELSRTPQLNSNLGKDHWPVTSAMAIGAGVAGGRAYGATNAKMEAEQVDFTTGAVSGSGKTLMTSNFVAGALAACGVDPAAHLPGVEVFDAFVA